MPFTKEYDREETRELTGINIIKNKWKMLIEDINVSSLNKNTGTLYYSYLCATGEERKLLKLLLLADIARRIGYKISAGIELADPESEPVDQMVTDMLQHILGKGPSGRSSGV